MSYFLDHADRLRVAESAVPDLRRGQRGALLAIGAHSTLHAEPAIVVMPTGSGKTAVLMLTPFLLSARRVLVVTPSRLVRNQIATQFGMLTVPRETGALVGDFAGPRVFEVEARLTSLEAWEALDDYDVVVGTPYSVSPAMEGIPTPPSDLFDLVLVDEAHHSPAATWNALLEAFPSARRVLFTATPFRRDGREIRGRFVYAYPVATAHADGIFGEVVYQPVAEDPAIRRDGSVALEAERILRRDRAAGLNHFLLVRTDTTKRAEELAEVYRQHTALRLQLVHSGHSYTHVRRTIARLLRRELDGVICVNMLGEGFDFPNLKIAAVHAPHKSLAVTLQFIGRFARTNASDIGGATFLAVPSDIEIEATRLYEEGAVWQQLVPGLLRAHIEREVRAREVLQTFEPRQLAEDDIEDVSLYALRPYRHVKVYAVTGEFRLNSQINLPPPLEIVYRQVSEEWSAVVFIAREETVPRWSRLALFAQMAYELFVVHFDAATGLLFLCASRRSDIVYDQIADQFCPDGARRVPLGVVNRALRGLTNAEFYNIGLRNSVLSSGTESYRIITGGKAHKAIRRSDAQLYHQGHCFGKATDGDHDVTIGLSSSAKIWSNAWSRLPELLDWCQQLAIRLASDEPVSTGCELDYLRIGEVVTEIPDGVIAASWPVATFLSPPWVAYQLADGRRDGCQLLDLDLVVDLAACDRRLIRLVIRGPGLEYSLDFTLTSDRHFAPADPNTPPIMVDRGGQSVSLADYLNTRPVTFYFADLSALVGRERYRADQDGLPPFGPERIEATDWAGAGVDIQVEFGVPPSGKTSVHTAIERRLLAEPHQVILYDHGSGELADFVAITEEVDAVCIRLYHCKGSSAAKPGDRVDDVYEVCGQAVKSLRWAHRPQQLLHRVKGRLRSARSRLVRGDLAELDRLLMLARGRRTAYHIIVVQPAIAQSSLSPKLASLLAAADDYICRAGCEGLRILGSA